MQGLQRGMRGYKEDWEDGMKNKDWQNMNFKLFLKEILYYQ